LKPWLVIVFSSGILGLLFAIASWQNTRPTNEQVVPYSAGSMLAVSFAHIDHTDQQCVACHHNFVDDTGGGLCFDCHKTDNEVADLIEEQFHDLCRGCHEKEQLLGDDHGPTRECIACHSKDDLP
jgi:hypothetical protein